jgi:glycosyltransferase involved in cell wall biosynthesis
MSHIFQISEDHSPNQFGVTTFINQLSSYLATQKWPTTVLCAGKAPKLPLAEIECINFIIPAALEAWRYPVRMKPYLENVLSSSDKMIHLHGVWKAPQWLGARIADRLRVPVVLSPHNMLDPWFWRNGFIRWIKKMAYWRLIAYPAFRQISVIHALTNQEASHLSTLFPGQRLEVIPNAIDLTAVDCLLAESEHEDSTRVGHPFLLFLGRLHPVKGIDLLIQAFARSLKGRDFHLVIAGPDTDSRYTAQLKTLVNELGINRQVNFLGAVYGHKKWRLYLDAWACCLPSRREGMSAVSLEIATTGTPLISTFEAGITDWQDKGAILVRPEVEELAKTLEQVFSWSDSERQARGHSLRQLVRQRYCWEVVGPQWLELYSSLL